MQWYSSGDGRGLYGGSAAGLAVTAISVFPPAAVTAAAAAQAAG